jgi:hypothetical protein
MPVLKNGDLFNRHPRQRRQWRSRLRPQQGAGDKHSDNDPDRAQHLWHVDSFGRPLDNIARGASVNAL